MEVKKRQHTRKKTTKEIKAQIEALQAELDAKEQAERIRIGEEMQKRFSLDTWAEIKKTLDDAGANGGS